MRTLHFHNSISVKQILFLWLVLCLVPSITQAGNRCDNSLTVPLLVDEKVQVGVVKVNYDDNRLNIKYVANDGWLIEKTHLAVSSSFEGVPQDWYGNPELDRFPYKTVHSSPVAVVNHMLSSQQWPLGTELYIAAQANVVSTKQDHHDEYGKRDKKRYSAKSRSYGRDKYRHHADRDNDHTDRKFNKFKRFMKNFHQARRNDERSSKHDDFRKTLMSKYFAKKHYRDNDYQRKYGHNMHDGKSHRHNKRCERSHKKEDDDHRGKSAWGKGEAFPGKKVGFYFTFTLKACKPPVASTFQFSDPSYAGSENDANAIITVTRSGDLNNEASVTVRTADGSAEAGIDYGAIDMQLLFASGQTAIDVMIPVIDDSDVEEVETINVQLFDAQGATLGDQDTSVVELADNDEPAPQGDVFFFDPADYIFRENSGLVTITVRRDGNLIGEASVDYLVVGGTAMPGIDYVFIPGTLVFADGQSTAMIELTIIEDRAVDPDETILVGIENPVNGQIIQPATAAVITIDDNEGNN